MVASQFDRRSFRSKVVSIEGRFDRRSFRSKPKVSSIEDKSQFDRRALTFQEFNLVK